MPDMRHLVQERLTEPLVALTDETVGIEGELMLAEGSDAARKTIRREMTGRMRTPLVDDEHITE